jgi:hypothetical protein
LYEVLGYQPGIELLEADDVEKSLSEIRKVLRVTGGDDYVDGAEYYCSCGITYDLMAIDTTLDSQSFVEESCLLHMGQIAWQVAPGRVGFRDDGLVARR